MAVPQWLDWVRRLQSIAQAGLTYTENAYDKERYRQIQQLASEIAASQTGQEAEGIQRFYASETGYSTPKVDVRGVVFNEAGQLLLVKEASTGQWTLPGGWADVWDTPSQAVEREIYEESGYEARATRLLALYDRDNQGHPPYPVAVYKLYFLCELTGGEPATSLETSAVGFFAEAQLPPLDSGRTLKRHVHEFFAQVPNGATPAAFD